MDDVELPLVPIIVRMQRAGIALDGKLLEGLSLGVGGADGGAGGGDL